jgi:hypothetical protein
MDEGHLDLDLAAIDRPQPAHARLTPVRVWDGGGPVLVDPSAWMEARRDPHARVLLLSAIVPCSGPSSRRCDLAATGSHRLPLTDLTVTLAAQAAGVDVLHFDQHLERLGEHLGVESHWISDPRDEAR